MAYKLSPTEMNMVASVLAVRIAGSHQHLSQLKTKKQENNLKSQGIENKPFA